MARDSVRTGSRGRVELERIRTGDGRPVTPLQIQLRLQTILGRVLVLKRRPWLREGQPVLSDKKRLERSREAAAGPAGSLDGRLGCLWD